jgi:hypothetical protein
MAAGAKTRAAIAAQPEWLLAVPTDRQLRVASRVVVTGCTRLGRRPARANEPCYPRKSPTPLPQFRPASASVRPTSDSPRDFVGRRGAREAPHGRVTGA